MNHTLRQFLEMFRHLLDYVAELYIFGGAEAISPFPVDDSGRLRPPDSAVFVLFRTIRAFFHGPDDMLLTTTTDYGPLWLPLAVGP